MALRELYSDGTTTVAAIAADLGRSVSAVHTRVAVLGLSSRARRWSADEDQQLLQLRADGASLADIAYALGRSVKAVASREVELDGAATETVGRSRRSVVTWSEEDDTTLAVAYSEGRTLEVIAAELDRPLHVVVDRIERARRNNIGAFPARRPRWTEGEKQRLARRYAEGASYHQLGLEFGRAKGSISRQLSTLRRLGYLDESHGA